MINTILLQQASGSGSGWSTMLLMIAMIVVFYFFMIRPQSKKQKEIKRQREAMKTGDKVVTAGGIHGKINKIDDDTIMIEVSNGVTLKVDKNSVFPYMPAPAAKK